MKKPENNIIHAPIMKIVIGGLICVLLPALINKLLLDHLFQLLGFNEDLNRSVRVFITTILLMPLCYYLLFKKLENRKITELKMEVSGTWLLYGFILAVFIIGLSFSLLLITGFIEISTIHSPKAMVVNIILILGLVITEEVFFRGIFYRIIENRWGTMIALISSALLFGLMHLPNENTTLLSFLSVISGGAVLGILFTYTKSLLVPIAFHFGWNLTQVLLGFGLSGGDEFSNLYLFKLNLSGSDLITGGASGIENSILAISTLIILFIVLYKKSLHSKTIKMQKK